MGGLLALKSAAEEPSPTENGILPAKPRKRPAKTAASAESPLSKMPKSAQRKRFGIYYTPPAFTDLIVQRTVDALIIERFAASAVEHGIDPESREEQDAKKLRAYWTDCLDVLRGFTVCDPACGSGAFLIRAYESLDAFYKAVVHGLAGAGMSEEEVAALENEIPDLILSRNLYGVDLSAEAVEITQLALWIRSARKGHTLTDLSRNIIWGNSLVADEEIARLSHARADAEKHPKAMGWEAAFPDIFSDEKKGFDCVVGNPPWERVKVQNREFFSLSAPGVLETDNPAAASEKESRNSKSRIQPCFNRIRQPCNKASDCLNTRDPPAASH